jgi:hypothetical protein
MISSYPFLGPNNVHNSSERPVLLIYCSDMLPCSDDCHELTNDFFNFLDIQNICYMRFQYHPRFFTAVLSLIQLFGGVLNVKLVWCLSITSRRHADKYLSISDLSC